MTEKYEVVSICQTNTLLDLKRKNTACRQQMTKAKFISQALQLTLELYISKSYWYPNSGQSRSVTKSSITWQYIEGTFCRWVCLLQTCFADSLWATIACDWKSMYHEFKEINAENVTIWSISKWMTVSDKDWYLTSWDKYPDTESCHL